MSGVTAQAKERRGLVQQVVGHGPMRLMANRAVLGHRRMLIRERSLLVRMAPIADHVDRRLFQIALRLAVGVVAVRTYQLAFLDRMMRRHRILGIDVAVALVACEWLIHGHGQTLGAGNVAMLNFDKLLNIQLGMGIMAVGTSHAVLSVRGRVPGHGRGTATVAGETKVRPRLGTDFAVRIMTSGATEARPLADLMRVGNVLLLSHVRMAAIADVRSDSA